MARSRPGPAPRRGRATAAPSKPSLLGFVVQHTMRAAEDVFLRGVQEVFGEKARAKTVRVAQRMCDAELGAGAYERLANSSKDIWIARAATALDGWLEEVGVAGARAPRRG